MLAGCIRRLEKILDENKVCKSHGIDHAIAVLNHAIKAIDGLKISECEKLAILLAALLHDADDPKFFSKSDGKNFDAICLELASEIEEINSLITKQDINETVLPLAKQMILLVSASKNGDNSLEVVPQENKTYTWMLIPRYCDRLEALGLIGIRRCFEFTKSSRNPLFIPKSSSKDGICKMPSASATPVVSNKEELDIIASPDRYNLYSSGKIKSASMLDHYYDKLVPMSKSIWPIENEYITKERRKREQIITDFVLYCCKKITDNGTLSDDDVNKFLQDIENEIIQI